MVMSTKNMLFQPFWRRRTLNSTLAFLFALNVVPLILLGRKFYIAGIVMIGVAYAAHYFSSLSRYEKSVVPRMRTWLYVDWPISYIVVFLASFLTEGWTILIFFIVLAYHLITEIRLGTQAIRAYYADRTKHKEIEK